jgi:hypothetical protein
MRNIFSHTTLQLLYQLLYESAKKVLEGSALPDVHREPILELESMADFRDSAEGQAVLDKSRDLYGLDGDSEVAIDDGTVVYHNETDGHWVMGWCFVRDDEVDDLDEPDVPFLSSPT